MGFKVLLVIFLSGCAAFHPPVEQVNPEPGHKVAPTIGTKAAKAAKPVPRASARTKTVAVFHLIYPQKVELLLKLAEDEQVHKVLVDKTLSKLSLGPGNWEVQGVEFGGKTYLPINPGQQFQFTVGPGQATYAGSYLLECPQASGERLEELKKFSFFNRYTYGSHEGFCELVIGNSFVQVNRAWSKIVKQRSLKLGF